LAYSRSNTSLFFVGSYCAGKAAAADLMGVKLDFVQSRWPDAEGPDEKVSRYAGIDVNLPIIPI
jgi:hypothetical protein